MPMSFNFGSMQFYLMVPYREYRLEHNFVRGMVLFVFLTIAYMAVNYVGVDILRLRTLNYERAEVVVSEVSQRVSKRICIIVHQSKKPHINESESLHLILKSFKPEEVHESLFVSLSRLVFSRKLKLGCRVNKSCYSLEYSSAMKFLSNKKYLVDIDISAEVEVRIMLKHDAQVKDKWEGFVHGQMILHVLQGIDKFCLTSMLTKGKYSYLLSILQLSNPHVDDLTSDGSPFCLEIFREFGWECDHLYLGYKKWRIDFP